MKRNSLHKVNALHKALIWPHISRTMCSRNDTPNPDYVLQKQFTGIMPRLAALWSLTEEKGFEKMMKLNADKVIYPFRPIKGLSLFADLHNPLLKKYEFDPVEFLEGAKQAYSKVHGAFTSVEFSNYINGFSNKSDENDLLFNCLHPSIYKACVTTARDLHKAGITTRVTGLEILEMSMMSIFTDVITEENAKEHTDSKESFITEASLEYRKRRHKLDGYEETDNNKDNKDKVEVEVEEGGDSVSPLRGSILPESEDYPIGSVVATVSVTYTIKEEYKTTSMIEDVGEIQLARKSETYWTFRGCISGQKDLHWKVVAFDGMGSNEI
eukprot:gene455-824_t